MELEEESNTLVGAVLGDEPVLGFEGYNIDSGDIKHLCCAALVSRNLKSGLEYMKSRDRTVEKKNKDHCEACYTTASRAMISASRETHGITESNKVNKCPVQ
jgi:hypothetical protein